MMALNHKKEKWPNQYKSFFNGNVTGDWRIKDTSLEFLYNQGAILFLCIADILHLLTDERLKTISLDDIAWKSKNFDISKRGKNCHCCNGKKYETCDIKFPTIVVKNISNPMNSKYRLIDGRHRSEKLLSQGYTETKCYVLQFDDIKKYLKVYGGKTEDGEYIFKKIKYDNKGIAHMEKTYND
jgi:hypothetical protein